MKGCLNTLAFIFVAFALLSESCGKKTQPGPKVYVDKDFLDYVHFNNGTRWIYMNTGSTEFDTCVVTGSSHAFEYHEQEPKESDPQFEEFSFRSDDRGIPIGVLTTSNPVHFGDVSQIFYSSRTFYMYDNILGPSYSYNLFQYPYADDTLRTGNEMTHIAERLDSIIVQNQTYHNIITTRHEFQQAGSLIREITYAKGIGPIRKVYWDGSTWELVDFTIE